MTDLDGTIVRADGSLSRATLEAVAALDDARIPLLLATARTPHGVVALTPLAEHASIAVCCNGAIGYEPRTGATLWRHEIPVDVLDTILAVIQSEVPGAGIGLYTEDRWLLTANYEAIRGKSPKGPYAVIDSLQGYSGAALGICHPTLTSAQVGEALRAVPSIAQAATISHAAEDILDITRRGIDKGTGLRDALDHLQLSAARCIAFGDAPNDLPMFHVASHSVAVANAHPAVLAAATTITDSVADDGFHTTLAALGII